MSSHKLVRSPVTDEDSPRSPLSKGSTSPGRSRERTNSYGDRSPSNEGSHYSSIINSDSVRRSRNNKNKGTKGTRATKNGKTSVVAGSDNVTQRILSARRLKINELRNELENVRQQMAIVMDENKTLKRSMHVQGRALEKYEGQENEMSTVLARHAEEIRVARESEKRYKERYAKLEKKLKEQDEDMKRTKKLLHKLKTLVEDKDLGERDELARKLAKVTSDLEDSNNKVKELERHVELLNKNHKHEIGIERARLRDTNLQVEKLQEQLQTLAVQLREKEKEIEARNIYSNQGTKSSQRAPSSTPPTTVGQRKASLPTTVNTGVLLRDKNSKASDTIVGMSPRQKAQKYNELLRARNEATLARESNNNGSSEIEHQGDRNEQETYTKPDQPRAPRKRQAGVTQMHSINEEKQGNGGNNLPWSENGSDSFYQASINTDKNKEFHGKGRDELGVGVNNNRRRRDTNSTGKVEPYFDNSKPWNFKSKKDNILEEENSQKFPFQEERDRVKREADERAQKALEEQKERELKEQEERERQERMRQEWERSERERREREVKEKWEKEEKERIEKELREQREKERNAQEQKAREEKEQQERELRERERQRTDIHAASKLNEPDKNDLLTQMLLIDKKQGKDTGADDFQMRTKNKDYQFTQPVENMHRGRPAHDVSSSSAKKISDEDDNSYMPSFGPGRFDNKAKTVNASEKGKKTNLMEDLFGKSSNVSSNNNKPNYTNGDTRRTSNFDLNDADDSSINSSLLPRRQRQSASMLSKPAVNAIERVDDDIEEVLL